MVPSAAKAHRLVILYGIGGLSDVGRHALQAALDRKDVTSIHVLTQHPELLELSNWECGCPEPHNLTLKDHRYHVVPIQSWTDVDEYQTKIAPSFEGATAVVSCLGNRQPGLFDKTLKKGWVSYDGNKAVLQAMKQHAVKRAVVISSVGIAEDWPPMEWHWAGKILACMFRTNTRKAFDDLTKMEHLYRELPPDDIDYLLVRPVGISEDAAPKGKWRIQKEKYKDESLGLNMAKMDVARFMVEEALQPTKHQTAVTIGEEPDDDESPGDKSKQQ